MGKGRGRTYSLKFNNETVASVQVFGKQNLEISRFCTKKGISVVGGFSKLLAAVIKTESPMKISTFIDKRYGDGSHLIDKGFSLSTDYLSFVWYGKNKIYHRMKFKGNSGYNFGLVKLWDCGQAKWEMSL